MDDFSVSACYWLYIADYPQADLVDLIKEAPNNDDESSSEEGDAITAAI